jgi:hypothetical protein
MSARWIVRFGLCLLMSLSWSPSEAKAKFFLFTHGVHITDLGEAKNPPLGLPANRVGYRYHHFGVFWINFWTWDGEYCVHDEVRSWTRTRAEAAQMLGVPANELTPPFWYRFPFGLMLVAGIVAVVIAAWVLGPKPPPPHPLLSDPRYAEALGIVSTRFNEEIERHVENPDLQDMTHEQREHWVATVHRSAAEAGIQHLVSAGVERNEAEKNLQELLTPKPS